MSETLRPSGFAPREAAYQLSISRSNLYRLIKEDLIRSVKIGDRRIIPATEIDRLLNVDPVSE